MLENVSPKIKNIFFIYLNVFTMFSIGALKIILIIMPDNNLATCHKNDT